MAGNYVQSFFGSVEVAKWLVEMGLAKSTASKTHITECCNKKKLSLLTGTYGDTLYFHKFRLSYKNGYLSIYEYF